MLFIRRSRIRPDNTQFLISETQTRCVASGPMATLRHTVEFIAMTSWLRFEKLIDHFDQF
jgi:hypothetical protein